MPKRLTWDDVGERRYETGVSETALFPMTDEGTYGTGVAWNGITAVNENPSGAETTDLYADDEKYLSLTSAEKFGCTIEAYTCPDEFEKCDGTAEIAPGVTIGQQERTPFGLVYKTRVGNDVKGNDFGYKLHIIYGAKATPSQKNYASINESPEVITFSWEVNTTPVKVKGFKSTASLVIDSTKVDAKKLAKVEEALYGSESADAKLLMPDEIAEMLKAEADNIAG